MCFIIIQQDVEGEFGGMTGNSYHNLALTSHNPTVQICGLHYTVIPAYKDIGHKDILGRRINFSIQFFFVSE